MTAERDFSRIRRLPPYVFNITAELKMAARRRGEDIIDMSMGNPDQPTPQHITDKLVEAAQRAFRLRFHPDRFADPDKKSKAEAVFKEAEQVFARLRSAGETVHQA